jgi:hypothetical protein
MDFDHFPKNHSGELLCYMDKEWPNQISVPSYYLPLLVLLIFGCVYVIYIYYI